MSKPELKALPESTLAILREVTTDPIDAMRLASDLYAMSAYAAEREAAIESGSSRPRLPTPISNHMQGFLAIVTVKLMTIGLMVEPDERRRLTQVGEALDGMCNSEVAGEFVNLVCMDPDEAVGWIREHFDELEVRTITAFFRDQIAKRASKNEETPCRSPS